VGLLLLWEEPSVDVGLANSSSIVWYTDDREARA
jgi:hypothetical protein